MPADIPETLARRLGIGRERVLPICELLDAGMHPVFIAHYRKSAAAGMDDVAIRRLAGIRRELIAVEDQRQKARHQAEQAGAMTEALAKAIAEATEPEVIEDLVRPYKPKRRTAGLVAQERGLKPLARFIAAGDLEGPDLAVKAAEFVNAAKEVRSPEEALAGASHILADRIAEDARIRQATRRLIWEHGILKSQQAKDGAKAAAEFKAYYQFQEAINRLPPHRILAVNRGERSKALKVTIEVPPEVLKERIFPLLAPPQHRFRALLESVAADAMARLVLPTVEREVRRQLTDRAESHAIEVFAANMRSLLMTRPVRGRRLLAIQPGFRTGCKIAALDPSGSLLGETIIYPLEPQKKWDEGKQALVIELQKHRIDTVAIGNGTGCREIEQLVSETIEEAGLDLQYAIVSEAGAAVYADSDLAHQEFPNLDAAIRATISIGRRLQEPLAELIKIDPRAIGVGLYQHDVNQSRLKAALEETMESCVAAVGADANAASPAMLRHIPGLTPQQAQSLAARRAQAPLASRDDLKTLAGWDDKTSFTAAGFLRIRGANPLDATRIHPEGYAAAERVLAHVGHSVEDLKSSESAQAIRKRLTGIALEPLAAELGLPLADLADLVGALQNPDHDPRSQHHGPVFRKKMRRIEDLSPGMWVKGTVRNVVDFGAFVDIGLKEDGLVHISQFSKRYVRNPLKFLHVGDVVDVRIVSIESDKHRIALTLISDEAKRPEKPAGRRQAPSAARGEARPPRPVPTGQAADAAAEPGAPRPAEAAAAPASTGRQPSPPRPAPAGRRPPRTGQRPAGRPARGPGERSGAPAAGRAEKSRGPRSDRGPRDRRPERSGPPRVIVSKSRDETEDRPPDEQGRPKIRWAYYESDIQEEAQQEFEVTETDADETETPATEAAEETPSVPQSAAPQPNGGGPEEPAPPPEAPAAEAPPPDVPAAQAPPPDVPAAQAPPAGEAAPPPAAP